MPTPAGSLPGRSAGSIPHLVEVELNGIPIQVRGPVQTEIFNIQGRKTNIGEPGPDDHPVNSTIIQSNFVGGGQVWKVNPAQDMNRFWWATTMTEYPENVTLAPLTYSYTAPIGAAARIIGDYPNTSDAQLYAYGGGRFLRFNLSIDDFDDLMAMGVSPVNDGVEYILQTGVDAGTSLLFIPQGSQYQTWNGAALLTEAHSAISFQIWDNKLFRLSSTGEVFWTMDHVTWQFIARLPDGSQPRHLVNFVNRQDQPTLYVVTNYYLWALNFDGQSLIQTRVYVPRHPVQGLGATAHQGELYTSSGLGIERYNLQTWSPFGIDRDQGLPPEFRGYIVDLETSWNGMYALVRGAALEDVVEEEDSLDVGGLQQMYAGTMATNSLLMVWNGDGWHYRWHGQGSIPTNMFVSQADSRYCVWWAAGGELHRQSIPFTYFNPRDPASALAEFEPEGELETGWMDWGWTGQRKLLKKLETGSLQCTPTEVIDVYYKVDLDDNDWVQVGSITSPGENHFFLGLDVDNPLMLDGSPRYKGVNHERFKLRFSFRRGEDKTKKPILVWYSAVGRKLLFPQRSWRFAADITQKRRGYPPGFLTHLIEELVSVGYAIPFRHRGKMYMVDVAAISGPDGIDGQAEKSFRTIHLLESNEIDTTGHEHEAP